MSLSWLSSLFSLVFICCIWKLSGFAYFTYASVTKRHSKLYTVLKPAYFMIVIDDLFCLGRACDKRTRDTFQSSRLTGARLWVVITLQTVWWETGGRSRSWNIDRHSFIFTHITAVTGAVVVWKYRGGQNHMLFPPQTIIGRAIVPFGWTPTDETRREQMAAMYGFVRWDVSDGSVDPDWHHTSWAGYIHRWITLRCCCCCCCCLATNCSRHLTPQRHRSTSSSQLSYDARCRCITLNVLRRFFSSTYACT